MKQHKIATFCIILVLISLSVLLNIEFSKTPGIITSKFPIKEVFKPLPKEGAAKRVVYHADNNNNGSNIDVCIIFCNGSSNIVMQNKLLYAIKSLLDHSSWYINIHIIGDANSTILAHNLITNLSEFRNGFDKVMNYNIIPMLDSEKYLIDDLQQFFSSANGYYSSGLFFLSLSLYKFIKVNTLILFDIDVKFESDIKYLQYYFEDFNHTLFGLAPELSPVYHHVLNQFRKKNNKTLFGLPLKEGFPGFNSGLVLMHLDNLRKYHDSFEKLTNKTYIEAIVKKYMFKGHLGDQDFYTLMYFENPNIFKILPCGWNRQLCKWWRNGYKDIFDMYYLCEEPVKMYHANCNAQFPYS